MSPATAPGQPLGHLFGLAFGQAKDMLGPCSCFIPKHNTCTTSCKHSDSSDQTLPTDFDCMLVVLWWPATMRFATCCEAYHPRTTSQGVSHALPRVC